MDLRISDLDAGDVVGREAGQLAGLDKEEVWYTVRGSGSWEPYQNYRGQSHKFDEVYVVPVELTDGSYAHRVFPDAEATVPVIRRSSATETETAHEDDRNRV